MIWTLYNTHFRNGNIYENPRTDGPLVNVFSFQAPMESLDAFESEMEADGQGNYSLFPALDSIAMSATPETLDRLFVRNHISVFYSDRI